MATRNNCVQTGNATFVVHSFGSIPCSVESYDNEKDALKRYESLKYIIQKRISQELGIGENCIRVLNNDHKTRQRIKTSRSNLPDCKFMDTGETLAVVRGPSYERCLKASTVPFLAINLDGDLDVSVFQDRRDADAMYDEIRAKYEESPTFQEDPEEGGKCSFSVDASEGPSVMVGNAKIIRKDTTWQIR